MPFTAVAQNAGTCWRMEIHRVESEEIKRERDRRDRVKEFKRRQLKLLQKRSDVDIFSNGFQISETFVQK